MSIAVQMNPEKTAGLSTDNLTTKRKTESLVFVLPYC